MAKIFMLIGVGRDWNFLKEGFFFNVDWYVREGFAWNAVEMGVCIGYVGVFIDSPDIQTHDPSSSRKRVKGVLLLMWASGINSPHPSQDGWTRPHYLHYPIFWPSILAPTPQSQARPFKNRQLNQLKLAQIRFAHLWQVTIPPPAPSRSVWVVIRTVDF